MEVALDLHIIKQSFIKINYLSNILCMCFDTMTMFLWNYGSGLGFTHYETKFY
jgi:hypothetical protein